MKKKKTRGNKVLKKMSNQIFIIALSMKNKKMDCNR